MGTFRGHLLQSLRSLFLNTALNRVDFFLAQIEKNIRLSADEITLKTLEDGADKVKALLTYNFGDITCEFVCTFIKVQHNAETDIVPKEVEVVTPKKWWQVFSQPQRTKEIRLFKEKPKTSTTHWVLKEID